MMQKIAALGILLAVLCLGGFALAQESASTPAPVAVAPVADQSHEPVPVPQPDALTVQRYRSGNIIWAVDQLLGLALPLLFLATGWSARMRDKARPWGKRWYFTLAIYFLMLSAAMGLLQLPGSFYVEFVREHAGGLSNQTLG